MRGIAISFFLLAVAVTLSCAPWGHSPADTRSSAGRRAVSVQPDSGAARDSVDTRAGSRIFVRDERYDWRSLAIAIDNRIICPKRRSADTTFWADIDSARAVPGDSIKAIETRMGPTQVPDSIQRVCPSRLRGVVYFRTK